MTVNADYVWTKLCEEGKLVVAQEPALRKLISSCVLDLDCIEEALSYQLACKLSNHALPFDQFKTIFLELFKNASSVLEQVVSDLLAIIQRDPACNDFLSPLLYFKGFHALTGYRIAHTLWCNQQRSLALYLQSLISKEFAVDIHPAARIGAGILIDHATSFVVGETAVIEDNVSILHEVTLGGTGKEHGDRHPKVKSGVLIGAGAKILGNVEIGRGAKIGAGSVVLKDVPAHTTVAGVPAKIVGKAIEPSPAIDMNHKLSENPQETSHNPFVKIGPQVFLDETTKTPYYYPS